MIKVALKAILPREFPSVMEEWSINEAFMPKASSGRAVPNEMKIIPKRTSGRFISMAIIFPDHTKRNELIIRSKTPKANLQKCLNVLSIFSLLNLISFKILVKYSFSPKSLKVYIRKEKISTNPSPLEMTPSDTRSIGKKAKSDINQKFSREILLSIFISLEKIATAPITNITFIILAPIILPKESSGTPWTVDDIPINNSGIEVAKLIRIKAIVYSESLISLERDVSELTNIEPERAMRKKEARNIIIYISILKF